MIPPRYRLFILTICLIGLPASALAQLAVQQPVFGVNSVNTTVSVPDRGTAHLGSISRAGENRTTFGPFRPGSSIGLSREHTSQSVSVYVHDFEAMDRYLLGQPTAGTPAANSAALTGYSRNAWDQLRRQGGQQPNAVLPDPAPISKAEKYWRLGRQAEQAGKESVARLHYRQAAKYGSEAAKGRLAQGFAISQK